MATKISRAASEALVSALLAETVLEVARSREDFSRALLVQPALLDDLKQSLQGTMDKALAASQRSEAISAHVAASARQTHADLGLKVDNSMQAIREELLKACTSTIAKQLPLAVGHPLASWASLAATVKSLERAVWAVAACAGASAGLALALALPAWLG